MFPKLLESLVGGEGEGSRRVQFAAISLIGIVTAPEFTWPIVVIAVAVIASLTLTDVLGKAEQGE